MRYLHSSTLVEALVLVLVPRIHHHFLLVLAPMFATTAIPMLTDPPAMAPM